MCKCTYIIIWILIPQSFYSCIQYLYIYTVRQLLSEMVITKYLTGLQTVAQTYGPPEPTKTCSINKGKPAINVELRLGAKENSRTFQQLF